MNKINEQVTEINEAISIINRISFQTNILSLNAAVNEETAGKAGCCCSRGTKFDK